MLHNAQGFGGGWGLGVGGWEDSTLLSRISEQFIGCW